MSGRVFSNVITAIDIGTTKICVLVARHSAQDNLEIIGVGRSVSYGLKKGVVTDIAKAVSSIKEAINDAQIMAGCLIERAVIGISGNHIQSFNSHGAVPIKCTEVVREDILAVLASAKAIALPEGQKILHVLPQYFMIDDNEKINDPIGMHGIRLEARVHIITGAIACVQNLIKSCELAGVQVQDIILEQVASASAVLSNDERILGVGVLDIGGGTSDLALYKNNSIVHTAVVPVAGNYFTHDLAIGLQTTLLNAEHIKKEYGVVGGQWQDVEFLIESLSNNEQRIINRSYLYNILQPRAEELFTIVKTILNKNQLRSAMTTGLVITGGGSMLFGIADLAHQILGLPVRLGKPSLSIPILSLLNDPIYATGYGLLLQALKKDDTATIDTLMGPLLLRVVSRMKTWVSDFF